METPPSRKSLPWYSVMVKPMNEQKFKALLEKLIEQKGLHEFFGDIYIPITSVQSVQSDGKKKNKQKKLMPGYVFVQMAFNEELCNMILQIPIVSGFLGATRGKEPPPVPSHEIEALRSQIDEKTDSKTTTEPFRFQVGDKVLVKEGPFRSFIGEIDQIKTMKAKLLISVFGRMTPVEIEFDKIEKIDPQNT